MFAKSVAGSSEAGQNAGSIGANISDKLDLTVMILTFNGALYIGAQLDSVLSQTILPEAIVVRDDGSSDATVDEVETRRPQCEALGVRLTVIRSSAQLGVAASFAAGIEGITTRYVALADQDDVWLPTKLELQMALLTDAFDVVGSNSTVVDASLTAQNMTMFDVAGVRIDRLDWPHGTLCEVLRGNFLSGMTLVMDTAFARDCCPIPPGWIHDYWIVLFAAAQNRLAIVTDPTVLYRQHQSNLVGASTRRSVLMATIDLLRERRLRSRPPEIDRWDSAVMSRLGSKMTHEATSAIASKIQFEQMRSTLSQRAVLPRLFWVARHVLVNYRLNRRRWLRDAFMDVLRSEGN